jgi:hypothetical protein
MEYSIPYTGLMNTTPLAIQNYVFAQYVKCAAKRGIAFHLTIQEFLAMASAPCVYCLAENSNTAKRAQYAVKEWKYNGVDRINSNLPYAVGNTVACCGDCNAAKSDMPLDQFLASDWLHTRQMEVNSLKV